VTPEEAGAEDNRSSEDNLSSKLLFRFRLPREPQPRSRYPT